MDAEVGMATVGRIHIIRELGQIGVAHMSEDIPDETGPMYNRTTEAERIQAKLTIGAHPATSIPIQVRKVPRIHIKELAVQGFEVQTGTTPVRFGGRAGHQGRLPMVFDLAFFLIEVVLVDL